MTTLSKSRFVQGWRCPRKVYYGGEKRDYRNLSGEDPFLQSLAEGGFQVGEFAKAHFPGGFDIDTLDVNDALDQTNCLLERENVVIFEAAVSFQNCFIRIDVLEKMGSCFRIHEVKAKSYYSTQTPPFLSPKGKPDSDWEPYLYDVAFQKWVVSNAFPQSNVTASLMLVDKSVECPVDGLNQCFRVYRKDRCSGAEQVHDIPPEVLDAKILKSVPVDKECDIIYGLTEHGKRFSGSFAALVEQLSGICNGSVTAPVEMRSDCGKCEFKTRGPDDPMKSGFNECLSEQFSIEPSKPGGLIFDVWNFRSTDKFIKQNVLTLSQLGPEDFDGGVAPEPGKGLNQKQRQWLQISSSNTGQNTVWIDKLGWQTEASRWTFPLHFIDFETTRVALPFFRGHKPYQSIAFQFSHHAVDDQGKIAHAHQFLHAQPGVNPNLHFVRALKDAIGNDDGTVFMYSSHENTTLRDILFEIERSDVTDREELVQFLQSITLSSSRKGVRQWSTSRPMVDQCELINKYLYLPKTQGSNSIKDVLPAILNESELLKTKYCRPIYGKGREVSSLNITERAWVKLDDVGEVINPYTTLPYLSDGLSEEERSQLDKIEQIANGGAALTAFGRLMLAEVGGEERALIERGLKEYCELDTLAMVFIYEGIQDLVNR